jgi:hypothetical protein
MLFCSQNILSVSSSLIPRNPHFLVEIVASTAIRHTLLSSPSPWISRVGGVENLNSLTNPVTYQWGVWEVFISSSVELMKIKDIRKQHSLPQSNPSLLSSISSFTDWMSHTFKCSRSSCKLLEQRRERRKERNIYLNIFSKIFIKTLKLIKCI